MRKGGVDPGRFDSLILATPVIYYRLLNTNWVRRNMGGLEGKPIIMVTVSGAPPGLKLDARVGNSLPAEFIAGVRHVALRAQRTRRPEPVMARTIETVDDYIATRSADVCPLLEDLRGFIHATMSGTSEEMRYGAPCFLNAHGVPVIYLFGAKHHVNFGFLRSGDLADPDGVLVGSGAPSKHIKLFPGTPYDKTRLAGFIHQCAELRR